MVVTAEEPGMKKTAEGLPIMYNRKNDKEHIQNMAETTYTHTYTFQTNQTMVPIQIS